MDNSHGHMVSLIWNIADDVLRDIFLRGQYRDVILPMVILRRLDALLEPTKDEVEQEIRDTGLENLDEGVLKDITGLSYFNTSKWTLNRLKSQATDNNDILYDNFVEYLNGYSDNVRDVLKTSRMMMRGHKWQLFVLELTFLGWALLCVLTLGIGFLWLAPYMEAAKAAFYNDLKAAQGEEAVTE